MTQAPIVVGVDRSGAARFAVRWAEDVARRHRAPLRRVHAGPVPVGPGVGVVDGAPLPVLLAEARSARMLVVGPTGEVPGMPGSLPARLAAYADCPVAIARQGGDGPVVAGIDGGPLSDAVLDAAFDEAASRGAPLVAVHAWSDAEIEGAPDRYLGWEPVAEAERRVLGENLAAWQEKYADVPLHRVAVRNRPRHLLLEWSARAQLVVVGSRGRGGFPGMALGSVAHALVQHGHGPVLVIRPPAGGACPG
ncbi:universal stress protein [Amycolatopsis sacchari]|uniref:universal stress protein n=1 Tax=Amycolatopsis sacchari TaxID=115433 RepID=UPI003EB6F90E